MQSDPNRLQLFSHVTFFTAIVILPLLVSVAVFSFVLSFVLIIRTFDSCFCILALVLGGVPGVTMGLLTSDELSNPPSTSLLLYMAELKNRPK